MEAGLDFGQAVRAALGHGGMRALAKKHELTETSLSAVLNGTARSPYHRVRDALADHFGVAREWIDEQADLARKRQGNL